MKSLCGRAAAWILMLLPVLEILSVGVRAQEPSPQRFSIGLIGDLAYTPVRETMMENVLADLDRTPLAFVVHLGDLGSPRAGSCSDALWARRLARFQAATNPTIYTPGDNDWTDCHEAQGVPGVDPAERISALRKFFFAGEETYGRRRFPLIRQSGDEKFTRYRENARWDMGGVTFMTLHVVGSNNNRARTPEADIEYAERTAAVLEWMKAGFAHAKARNSRGVMILQQANMFPNIPPFPGNPKLDPSGFAELRLALAGEAIAFGKPVVLAHGDSHYFRVDKPFLMRRDAKEPAVVNLTRLETFGDPFHHWVEVVVDAADPNVFVFRQRLIEENFAIKR